MSGAVPVAAALADCAHTLAGLPSPDADAAALLAFAWGRDVRGLSRARLMGEAVPADVLSRARELCDRRAERIPLQHITGEAHFRTLTLPVGPGVFIPRPETELLLESVLAFAATRGSGEPLRVVDLCAGSGAIALSAAAEIPGAQVLTVELSAEALAWTRRSAAQCASALAPGSEVVVASGDACDAEAVSGLVADRLGGPVDVVVSNPPYVVDDGTTTDVETLAHDPAEALWGGGADGTEIPRRIVATAAAVLTAGGLCAVEHADTQGAAMREAFAQAGFGSVRTHADYTGRDRFTTGLLQGESSTCRALST